MVLTVKTVYCLPCLPFIGYGYDTFILVAISVHFDSKKKFVYLSCISVKSFSVFPEHWGEVRSLKRDIKSYD
jgi:hypothetical protein